MICFSLGWVDCWTTPIVALSIKYNYHPSPILADFNKPMETMEAISTPELEEQLLIPLKLIPLNSQAARSKMAATAPEDFDASEMEADEICLELEVGPSVLCLYGSLLRTFLHVKVWLLTLEICTTIFLLQVYHVSTMMYD